MSATTTDNVSANGVAPEVQETAPVDQGFKVYIGNLSYSATEDSVREFVSQAGGEVLSVTIPKKVGRRPAGYAFVAYKAEADAKKAVEQLNEKVLDERPLRLELAKPDEEVQADRKAKEEKRAAAKKERDAEKKAAKAAQKAAADAAAVANGEAVEGEAGVEGEVKPKKKRSKAKKPRRRLPADGEESGEEAEEGAPARIDDVEGAEKKPKKKAAPKPREKRLQVSEEDSASTIFVANLPYSVDDEALANIFSDLSIKVKSAKIITRFRRIKGVRTESSKGFGFVDLEDESQREEAVKKVEGTLVEGRNITAKVAKVLKPIEGAEAGEDAPAAETAAPVE
ncbi:hypothetical protein IAT38_000595 [Cryptococcus sp. DSM 104549]